MSMMELWWIVRLIAGQVNGLGADTRRAKEGTSSTVLYPKAIRTVSLWTMMGKVYKQTIISRLSD